MYIELTDHLRCSEDHPEQYLVLLPGETVDRRVVTGDLGCPVCGRVVRLEDGVADFGGGAPSGAGTALGAEAVAAFLGITGPGGYVGLVGGVTALAGDLRGLLPGVRFALVNPPAGTVDAPDASVLRAARLPLKTGSMRGVVLGRDATGEQWIADAIRAVLPGLRVVSEGGRPPEGEVELLGESDECWIGKRIARRR